ncbi:MAG TPA: signal peptide peptidase SppA, partial [Planctomycetaceae bacterium]
AAPTIVIQQPARFLGRTRSWFFTLLLIVSLLANITAYTTYQEYFAADTSLNERYHSGDHFAENKLAIIRVNGVIMTPFSDRVIKTIKKVLEDENVKGVLLAVDSPGGTVTNSHQIYHELKKLAEKKPVVVSMGSLAASGGYMVAMGAGPKGKIFAEPTTWTGSIGVIIPHYEVTEVAEKIGFKAAPLKTGEFKDSLSPFRELSPRDKEVWDNILNQSFEMFLTVIDENRDKLDLRQVRKLATGQIYTAHDAQALGMIDEIGFEEDALEELKKIAGLSKARVVTFQYPVSIFESLLGSAKASDPAAQWKAVLELAVPRAMYYFSGGLPLPPE